MYKSKYVQENSCTSRGPFIHFRKLLLNFCFQPVKKTAKIVSNSIMLSGVLGPDPLETRGGPTHTNTDIFNSSIYLE